MTTVEEIGFVESGWIRVAYWIDRRVLRVARLEGAEMTNAFHNSEAVIHEFPLLTNHAYVLVMIAQTPNIRMREIAVATGITERAVQRIVEELTSCGHIAITKSGRRNRYEIQPHSSIRHPLAKNRNIGELIQFMSTPPIAG
jgi:MarR family